MEPSKEKERGTRLRIVQAADELFYRRGFERTSFADIAEVVETSRGNFYHHFKAKDDLLGAVVQSRKASTRQMLDQWEAESPDPRERIRSFIDILSRNRALILEYGCPVGTLCAELAKLGHPALGEASALFTLFRAWLRQQFEQLGVGRDADRLAMELLARSQGVATLANAFDDDAFLRRSVTEMHAWLEASLEGASVPPRAKARSKRKRTQRR